MGVPKIDFTKSLTMASDEKKLKQLDVNDTMRLDSFRLMFSVLMLSSIVFILPVVCLLLWVFMEVLMDEPEIWMRFVGGFIMSGIFIVPIVSYICLMFFVVRTHVRKKLTVLLSYRVLLYEIPRWFVFYMGAAIFVDLLIWLIKS